MRLYHTHRGVSRGCPADIESVTVAVERLLVTVLLAIEKG